MITIADTGTGISPELMPQLFKAFVSTKGIGGTGPWALDQPGDRWSPPRPNQGPKQPEWDGL